MTTEADTLLEEYKTLRAEVIERVKTAFSHLAYFGAVVAFAFKSPEGSLVSPTAVFWLAFSGAAILLYISVINWFWVGRIASHLQVIEEKLEALTGKKTLTWERKAETLSRWVLLPPRKYAKDKVRPLD